MNAQLKPITARCIEPPRYDNRPTTFGTWQNANRERLKAYYKELGRFLPNDADDSITAHGRAHKFIQFCKIQWDREQGEF